VDNAITNRVNIFDTPDLWDSGMFRDQPLKHVIERRAHVAQRSSAFLPWAGRRADRNNCLSTNSLDLAAAKALIGVLLHAVNVCGDDLKLQSGAARVEYKYVHTQLSSVHELVWSVHLLPVDVGRLLLLRDLGFVSQNADMIA
jgi:hypothetical protein